MHPVLSDSTGLLVTLRSDPSDACEARMGARPCKPADRRCRRSFVDFGSELVDIRLKVAESGRVWL